MLDGSELGVHQCKLLPLSLGCPGLLLLGHALVGIGAPLALFLLALGFRGVGRLTMIVVAGMAVVVMLVRVTVASIRASMCRLRSACVGLAVRFRVGGRRRLIRGFTRFAGLVVDTAD